MANLATAGGSISQLDLNRLPIRGILTRMNSTQMGRLLVQVAQLTIVARFFPKSLYEREVREYIQRHRYTKPSVDIGANTGYFSLLMSKTSPFVFAIEPLQRNCSIIAQLCRIFRVRNVRVLQTAVSDKNGSLDFYVRPDNIGTIYQEKSAEILRVPSRTLTSLFKDAQGISLIKVDAEGAEFAILRGAEDMMSRIDEWIIEIHDPKEEPAISSFLKDRGYSFYNISPSHLVASRQ